MTVVDERTRDRRDGQHLERHARDDAVADHDGERRGEAGAGRDAGQHRIGERVAEQALHHGAAGREQRADHHGERDARQPHRPQHELVARGERGVAARHKAERGGQAAQRNAGRADRCGNRRRRNERDDERADDQHR